MERCFIINKNTSLYQKYIDWEENVKTNNEIIKKFLNDMGIKATKCCLSNRLGIVPTDLDLKKFKNQLMTTALSYNGIDVYEFKNNSFVGKAYTALKLKVKHKPNVVWESDIYIGKCLTRLFMQDKVLYATLDADGINKDTRFPSGWKEIKKSEFYKILEKTE